MTSKTLILLLNFLHVVFCYIFLQFDLKFRQGKTCGLKMFIFKFLLMTSTLSWPIYADSVWFNHTIDAPKYFQMPELNKFDDYESCLETYREEAKYCYVKTAIQPDASSELYKFIMEFSSLKKQHFRHDKLTRGVCINTCLDLIRELGASADDFYVSEFKLDYKINFDYVGYANSSEDREKYNRIVNQCVNVELIALYNLRGFSSLEYCTQKEVATKIDALDIFFVVACSVLFAIVYISSYYDERLRIAFKKSSKVETAVKDHYKTAPPTLAQKFMVAYSFRRNWYLLSAPTKTDMRDLRSISAIRIWTMLAIVYGHCSWFSLAVPIQNPFYVEKSYHQLWTMIVINGGNLVQSFFFLSGFLNSIVFLAYIGNKKVRSVSTLLKTLIYRYIRFAPVLLFLVLLHATWLYRFDTGPFWDKLNFLERQSCRKNMWTNLLFINNYVSGDMKCMVHSWFISADLHLSILATGIFLLVAKFPQRRNLILMAPVVISFVISFVHFYVNKLEPIMMLTPESLRNQLMDTNTTYDRYFYDFHSPTHLNTGNYFIGLVIGYFYCQFKKDGNKHRRTFFFHILWHLSYIMTFVLCYVGLYFYKNDIEKGIWSALLGAILKHIYAPIFGFLLVGIIFRYGQFIPRWYNYGMYRILARLSFSVYMVHVTIASVLISGYKQPIEVNNASLNANTSAVYIFSHGAALFLVLCIELPAHVIYKIILNEIIEKPNKLKTAENGNINNGFEGHKLPRKDVVTKC